ncbi:MAG: plasmid mobilization relaxosome protein MobC [Vicinamibacterales bacterium]
MAGSGTEKRKKGRVITARFDDGEAEAIRRMADKAGVSIGALLRHAVFNTLPPPAARRPCINVQAVAQLLAQLGKIGSNINQLAKHANAGRSIDSMDNSIELALRDLSELRIACLQALGCEPDRGTGDDEATEAMTCCVRRAKRRRRRRLPAAQQRS